MPPDPTPSPDPEFGAGLRGLFAPTSIAVVGASTRPDTVGHAAFRNILFGGFTGCVYPVNPKARSILGVRAYRDLREIGDPIDLAVLVLPAVAVSATLEILGEIGTKHAIVISAGFKEVGGDGDALEAELRETASSARTASA